MTHLSIIAAVSRNGVIGANGSIPWRLPEDLKFFKKTTLGHAVIMGRKTFESIGRSLPGRRNIIVSRSVSRSTWPASLVKAGLAGIDIASSFEKAVAYARDTDSAPFVIGGAAVYAEAIPLADRMYITEVHRDVEGDALFPVLDRSQWEEIERDDHDEFSWVTLARRV